MAEKSSRLHQIAQHIRSVAKVWSIFVFILALILVIGTRKGTPTNNLVNEPLDILIPVSLLISLVGLGIAWRWEGYGVLINFGFYLAVLPLYWLLHRDWLDISIMVGLSPVILPGVLFAVAWILSQKRKP